MKIGILIAVGACGVVVGIVIGFVAAARINPTFGQLPVSDRSPAQRALRIVNQIATEHGLTQAALLKAMVDHQEHSARLDRPDGRE